MTPGYAFVPFPQEVRRCRRDAARHDRCVPHTLTGALRCEWVAEQPIHVGSGFKSLLGDVIVREGVRVEGRPGIPGSTLKGVLRARFEAITRSCAPSKLPREPRKINSTSFPSWRAVLTNGARSISVLDVCQSHSLCPACALFGKMSLRSRLSVEDLRVIDPTARFDVARMPKQFSPNLHHVGTFTPDVSTQLLRVTALHGRKFAVSPGPTPDQPSEQAVEAIAPRTSLVGTVRFINLEPDELGGVLVALGQHAPTAIGPIKLGGGKCHGFGRLRLTALEFTERGHPPTSLADEPRIGEWLAAFRKGEDCFPAGLERLLQIHRENC